MVGDSDGVALGDAVGVDDGFVDGDSDGSRVGLIDGSVVVIAVGGLSHVEPSGVFSASHALSTEPVRSQLNSQVPGGLSIPQYIIDGLPHDVPPVIAMTTTSLSPYLV